MQALPTRPRAPTPSTEPLSLTASSSCPTTISSDAAPPPPAMATAIERLLLRVVESILANEDPAPVLGGSRGLLSRDSSGDYSPARSFLHTLRALSCAHELLVAGRTASLRELYYLNASLMDSQAESNAALARAQALLGGAPRHALGLFSAARGQFAGLLLRARAPGGAEGGGPGWAPLPPAAQPVLSEWVAPAAPGAPRFSAYGARFLLVVEKEAIFRRLVEDRIWLQPGLGCVLLTGCGMPCLATRATLKQLADAHPGIPVLGLADYNPYGLGILMCYAHGAAKRGGGGGGGGGEEEEDEGGGGGGSGACDAVPQLRWLGLRGVDLPAHGVPAAAMQPLTPADRSRAAGLAACPHVARSPPLAAEVAAWRAEGGAKAELEALMSRGVGYLAGVYLPTKLGVAGAHVASLSERYLDVARADALPLGIGAGAPGEGAVVADGAEWEEEAPPSLQRAGADGAAGGGDVWEEW